VHRQTGAGGVAVGPQASGQLVQGALRAHARSIDLNGAAAFPVPL
jgi:hypothetical protein